MFSQEKLEKYDYFVQFNTQQFAKKVNIDSLFNHKVFKSVNQADSDFKLNDFILFIDKSNPVTIHGNFTDSITYYREMTFPLKDVNGWNAFIKIKSIIITQKQLILLKKLLKRIQNTLFIRLKKTILR